MTEATGGIISYANGKKIHTFTESGTFSVTEAGNVESLVVAGGGAGGGDYANTGSSFGGGGGGGVIYTSALTVGVGNVAVVVGEGGVSAQSPAGSITDAENTTISDGNVNFTAQTAIRGGTATQNGGSGGGGGYSGSGTGGTGTASQGNDGGDVTNFFTGAAGGGGAGSAGENAPATDFTDIAGAGGDGLLSSISGTSQRYGAGGGGGAWQHVAGTGGLGGGGTGGKIGTEATHGSFYGAGGGGQGGTAGTGGRGHKGVVIFSYDSDFTTGRRVAENEDLADMAASTIKGRITTDGIPQDLNASEVATILSSEITERAQDAVGAMVADTATIDLTYTDATPALTADVKVDSINDTHIDWGTGTNQVNLDDVPDGSTYVRITATNHTDLTDGGNTTLHTHGIYGLLSGTLAQFAATTSLELKGVISDETGTGALVFGTSPTLTAPVIGNFFYANHTHAASGVTGGTLASATGLPLTTGVTGILPAANGGTGIDNSTRTLTISTNAGTISFSAAASTLTIPATGTAALLATANVFTANQTLGGASDPKLILNEGNTGTSLFEIIDTSATLASFKKTSASGVALIDFDPLPSDGTSNASFRFFRSTNTSGQVYLQVYKGDNTSTIGGQISGSSAAVTYFGTQNNVGVGTASPAGRLHVVGLADDEQFIVDFYSTQSTVTNPIRFRTSAGADLFTFSALGAFLSTGATGGIGYTTGAGGTVTQATNKATGVTLNKVTGLITMNNAALAADTTVSFTLTSSAIAATDTIILQHNSAGTVGSYTFGAQPAAGSAVINVRNVTAGSLSEAIVIRYTVIKSISA